VTSTRRCVRLHRALLQSEASSLDPGLTESDRLRRSGELRLKMVSTESVAAQLMPELSSSLLVVRADVVNLALTISRSTLLFPQLSVEKIDYDLIGVTRFGQVGIKEERVPQPFEYMKLSLDSCTDQHRVRMHY